MRDLGTIIDEARRSALAPEQALLTMVTRRKASRQALTLAREAYAKATLLIEEALATLPQPSKSNNKEEEQP